MTAAKSVRQHARERGALDGADAQALEHALTVTERERDAWERRARVAVLAMNARPHTRECVRQSAYNIACVCGIPPEDDHE